MWSNVGAARILSDAVTDPELMKGLRLAVDTRAAVKAVEDRLPKYIVGAAIGAGKNLKEDDETVRP